jgi:hypothetical protein
MSVAPKYTGMPPPRAPLRFERKGDYAKFVITAKYYLEYIFDVNSLKDLL